MTEAIVTETEHLPIAAPKFRPRTPIQEDAQEMASASPRPSIDIGKSIPSPSPTPSNQLPTEMKAPPSDAKAESGTEESASSSQPPKVDPKATGTASQPQKSDEQKATEAAPQAAIKTYTTEKGKSKVTGKTITGWI